MTLPWFRQEYRGGSHLPASIAFCFELGIAFGVRGTNQPPLAGRHFCPACLYHYNTYFYLRKRWRS